MLTGLNVYTAEGTNNAYPGGTNSIKVDFTNGISNGTVKMVVRNGMPDNCTSYSDSFVYVGTAQAVKGNGKIVSSYSGSGTWKSYCYGSVLNTGTWSAAGPCGSGSSKQQHGGIAPSDGKQKTADLNKGISTSPNPAISFTTLTYSVKNAGKATITVFNSMNQPVKTLVSDIKAPGTYSIQWNLQDMNNSKVSTGIYRAVLATSSGTWSSNIQVLGN